MIDIIPTSNSNHFKLEMNDEWFGDIRVLENKGVQIYLENELIDKITITEFKQIFHIFKNKKEKKTMASSKKKPEIKPGAIIPIKNEQLINSLMVISDRRADAEMAFEIASHKCRVYNDKIFKVVEESFPDLQDYNYSVDHQNKNIIVHQKKK